MKERQAIKLLNEILLDNSVNEEYKDVIQDFTDGDKLLCTPFEIANDFTYCDMNNAMPLSVAEFVISVYFDEIDENNAEAMCNLGELYYTGRGGRQSYAEAIKYYTMADERGDRQAAENLGYCYYYGRAVEIDYEKAFKYFLKGALDNRLNSLYKVGDMYAKGLYVKEDKTEAAKIYEKCYTHMDDEYKSIIGADICMRMGNVYFEGMGREKNYFEAIKYYQQAEQLFYEKFISGDYVSKRGLRKVIERQNEIRDILIESYPELDWNEEDE